MSSIMESVGKKRARPRRSFTPEFKAEIVAWVRSRSTVLGRQGR
jgi:transposase